MKEHWLRSRSILVSAAFFAPPLGLVFLWLRPGVRFLAKVLGSLPILFLALIHLVLFWGLRAELDGSGRVPILYFGPAESHYSELEQHREVQDHRPPALESLEVRSVSASTPAVSSDGLPYWTRFRGPNMDGHYQQMPIRTDWPAEGLPLLWKQPVGEGYASFVIANGRAFTIEQRRDREVVAAYELGNGREAWTHSWQAEFQEYEGGDGPRATPTWDEGRLYALGAIGEFRVLNAESGELIWKRNILRDNGARNLRYGNAASPLIVDEKVVVLPGGPKGRSVVAYHKLTGEPVWSSLDDAQAYTSPMLVRLAEERQILVVSRERAMGLRPDDGTLLWDYPWTTTYGANVAQPILLGANRFFISAGYGHGAAVVEVTGSEAGLSARTIWANNRMKNKFSSSVLHDGYIYGMDEAIMACIDPETGDRLWKGGRYGYGEVMLASGHLIVLTEKGELVLVKATPESHQELARFSAIRGKTWNHPAIADGVLLVRNGREMAAFRIASP